MGSPGSLTQWLSDAGSGPVLHALLSSASRLRCLSGANRAVSAASIASSHHKVPGLGHFPLCISTESEQNFYRKLTADPSSPFVGQNWVACQSSVSHCGGNRTTIIGFDKSEPAHGQERWALEKRLRSCQQTGERIGVWGKSPGTGCCLGHCDQALGY